MAQESAAANYLQEKLRGLGYATEIQEFPVMDHSLEGLGLALNTPQRREFVAVPMSQSGLGNVSGILTHVGLATLDEIPASGLKGRIALAKRGVIRFQVKAENVFAAGAVGLVVYNSSSGIFQGSLAIELQFPVIFISGEDGEAIEGLLAEAETQAAIVLTMRERTSRNVIAEKSGSGEAVVVLGGHYDLVAGIAGANDNASGTAVFAGHSPEAREC
jgi:Zn-dependent M28 family amino/carboxypeptidase